MQPKTKAWHKKDISQEMAELVDAVGFVSRWSEYADVVYSVTRARWGGYEADWPISKKSIIYGSIYMFPKYVLRFAFFRHAGKKINPKAKLVEVRNPQKIDKLEHIANKYDLPADEFIQQCKKQLKHWVLLK